ncbi:MAG: hypothetical protein CL677_10390 [Bdellovibrionaceae bacterium]|nr:hypothetical protein [Pseudobdellovibrionaceae bacterium]|tara:strand:- start:14046 stop:14660 length:615 start_codon:yes stop_codon:yes gene_type:complete
MKTNLIYNRLSSFYDTVFETLLEEGLNAACSKIPSHSKVLELGIGSGGSLSHYNSNIHLTAVEISSEMLKQAREKAKQRSDLDIEFILGDATHTPINDKTFDFVVSFSVITVVDRPDRLVEEALRLCRPGGSIMIIGVHKRSGLIGQILSYALDPLSRISLGFTTRLNQDIYSNYQDHLKSIEFVPTNHLGSASLSDLVILTKK